MFTMFIFKEESTDAWQRLEENNHFDLIDIIDHSIQQ